MIKNYLIIAYRNMLRNKLRTAVHVLGLAIGVAVCLLVFQVVSFESSFDKFHEDGDNIFQVTTETFYMEESWENSGVPFPLGAVIKDEVSEVAVKTHFYTLWDVKIVNPEKEGVHRGQSNIVLADHDYFSVFDRTWLAGNPETALKEQNQVVLTAGAAAKYFEGLDAQQILGKELDYFFMDTIHATVVGVVADYTAHSDLIFTDFLSKANILVESKKENYNVDLWNSVNSSSQLFVKLHQDSQVTPIHDKLKSIVNKYMKQEDGEQTVYSLMPLKELHFKENFDRPGADKEVLRGLVVIGFCILILACMNFINLETAQSIIRSKEVGIRKTLGSSKPQLLLQFLSETALIVLLAIILGIVFSELLAGFFHDFLPKEMKLEWLSGTNLIFLFGLGMFLTVFSGLFPALILSGYQPQKVLKGDLRRPNGFSIGHFLQKNLTVLQFALSIGFIISVLVVSSQINFLVSKDLGFDKEQIMYYRMPYLGNTAQRETFKAQLEQQAPVIQTSISNDVLASSSLWTSSIEYTAEEEVKEIGIQVKNIDAEYLPLFGVELLFGRNIRNVSNETVINETLVRHLGFEDGREAIGKTIKFQDEVHEIVGVIPDLHARTLREEIRPLVMYYRPQNSYNAIIKLDQKADLLETKAKLDGLAKSFFPLEEEEFRFFDETIAKFYESDYRLQKILAMATTLALLISFLGLFALTSFTIAQRSKEISIRKVLGATVVQLLLRISKEYVWLLVFSFVLAVVPSWYLLDAWLENFQFRIAMPYVLFVMAGLAALAASLLIVSLHGYNVAQKNPAEVLKCE